MDFLRSSLLLSISSFSAFAGYEVSIEPERTSFDLLALFPEDSLGAIEL